MALVRNPKSDSAKALAVLPNVTVIEGKYENVPAIFESAGAPLWGVFMVLAVGSDEVKWGKEIIDHVKKVGVEHFVYSGVDKRNAADTGVEHVSELNRSPSEERDTFPSEKERVDLVEC